MKLSLKNLYKNTSYVQRYTLQTKPFIRAKSHKICSKTWIFGGKFGGMNLPLQKTPPFQKMTKKTLRQSVVMRYAPRFMYVFFSGIDPPIFLLLLPGVEKKTQKFCGLVSWLHAILTSKLRFCNTATLIEGFWAQIPGFSGDHLEAVGKKWLVWDWVDGIRFLVGCFEKWKQKKWYAWWTPAKTTDNLGGEPDVNYIIYGCSHHQDCPFLVGDPVLPKFLNLYWHPGGKTRIPSYIQKNVPIHRVGNKS